MTAAELAAIRQRLANLRACGFGSPIADDVAALLAHIDRPPKIGLNDDGTLDEVFAPGFHLEQMADNHWWLCINGLHINLYTKRANIGATWWTDSADSRPMGPG